MDVVELAPLGGQPASDFVAAKLAYKCIGYKFCDRAAESQPRCRRADARQPASRPGRCRR